MHVQEREQAVSACPSSQDHQRAASMLPQVSNPAQLHQASLPPRHSIVPAKQGGAAADSASLTATKLLNQIGQMAMLEEQV